MIEFICDYKTKIDRRAILQLDYADLISDEQYFCIKINGNIFYEQPLFPILEFLFAYLIWDKKHNFIFNTIESEENPMIVFKHTLRGWKLDSVWKKFDCLAVFNLNEIVYGIEKMIDNF